MIGIDYSMTCPAACHYTPNAVSFWYAHDSKLGRIVSDNLTHSTNPVGLPVHRRAVALARACVDWILNVAPDVRTVGLEDYAFAATGRVFHIGENTGILKYFLDDRDIDFHPIPPTVIKKFATGKGNADKTRMTDAFLNTYSPARNWIPLFFPRYQKGASVAKSPMADLADAYWIARYTSDHFGLDKSTQVS